MPNVVGRAGKREETTDLYRVKSRVGIRLNLVDYTDYSYHV